MFVDSVCDSSWSDRCRRSWITLTSFLLQALGIACLLLLPLVYTQGLPHLALLAPLLAPVPPPAAQAPPRTRSAILPQSNLMGDRLLAPSEIPATVNMLTEVVPPPPVVDPSAIGISHGTGDFRGRSGVLDSIASWVAVGPTPPAPTPHYPPVSHMMEGNLVRRVEPRYPPLAIQAHIQGVVVLRAVISRAGLIEHLQFVSGHPMLAQAAMDAVSQWRYRPYVLNGEPVEVETEVKVNFILTRD